MITASRTFCRRPVSTATMIRILFVIAGVTIMAACGGSGGGGSTTTTTSPAASLSVSSLTFSAAVGATSAAQTVTVSDTGTATLTFSGITPSPSANFSASTTTCSAGGIGAGATCTISVTFTSSTAGTVPGSLMITDNAGTQTVTLSGTAATPTVTVTRHDASPFRPGLGTSSASQSVTVINTGTVPLYDLSTRVSRRFLRCTITCPACNPRWSRKSTAPSCDFHSRRQTARVTAR